MNVHFVDGLSVEKATAKSKRAETIGDTQSANHRNCDLSLLIAGFHANFGESRKGGDANFRRKRADKEGSNKDSIGTQKLAGTHYQI